MKKAFIAIIGIFSVATCVNAQGTFFVDSSANGGNGSSASATTGGLVWFSPDGNPAHATLDTSTDINLQLLWGTTAGNVFNVLNLDPLGLNSPANTSWLAGKPTGATDISFAGNGTIVDPNGIAYSVPGQAAGSTIFISLLAWTGPGQEWSNADDGQRSAGPSTPFAITLALNTSPIQPDLSGMPAIIIGVPEPGTFALAGFGAAALMVYRRRK